LRRSQSKAEWLTPDQLTSAAIANAFDKVSGFHPGMFLALNSTALSVALEYQ
jgi:hypothetical protein